MFVRVCVDLDEAGNVIGASYEALDTEGTTALWTTTVAPFDTPAEAFESALEEARSHIGWQRLLF